MPSLTEQLGFKRRDNPAAYSREWSRRNREKLNAYHREYHEAHKSDPEYRAMKNEAAKVARRKKKYGITREGYSDLLTQQEGRCMICKREYGEQLRVDHDHSTGEVRSLLCTNCNSGLGLFQENPEVLRAAIAYVERFAETK